MLLDDRDPPHICRADVPSLLPLPELLPCYSLWVPLLPCLPQLLAAHCACHMAFPLQAAWAALRASCPLTSPRSCCGWAVAGPCVCSDSAQRHCLLPLDLAVACEACCGWQCLADHWSSLCLRCRSWGGAAMRWWSALKTSRKTGERGWSGLGRLFLGQVTCSNASCRMRYKVLQGALVLSCVVSSPVWGSTWALGPMPPAWSD